MRITLLIETPSGEYMTREVDLHIQRYKGTTDAGGDDPSSAAITKATMNGRDVTNALDTLLGLDNVVSELEIE